MCKVHLCLTVAVVIGLSAVRNVALAERPHLPIRVDENQRIDGGEWVAVQATLSDGVPARLTGEITATCYVFLKGFVGTALVDLLDGRGNLLARIQLPTIGVNARIVPARNKSTKVFQHDIPADIADSMRSIRVRGYHADDPGLAQKLDEAKELVKKAKDLLK